MRWRGRAAVGAMALVVSAAGCTGGGGSTDPSPTNARVSVVSQNLLHGIACPAESDRCDLDARVALFMRQLDENGCPALVSVQEANARTVSLLREEVPTTCHGQYTVVWDDDPGLDREVVLTTLPVLGSRRTHLAGPLRTALWVRVAADVGVVDFVSSHLASSSDDRPCDRETCPPPCAADGTVNACQGRQLVQFADEVSADDSVVIVGGDLNAEPSEPAIAALTAAQLTDSHIAASNAECQRATGSQCTSGRVDSNLTDLTNPASTQSERIDYLFFGGRRTCKAVAPTGLFNAEPATPAADGLVFPSDHTGVRATVECETSAAQRASAPSATVTTVPPSTSGQSTDIDVQTTAAITQAFETLFNGDVSDVEQKLAVLEDSEALRPYFLQTYQAQQPIASRIRVRIDDVEVVDPDHANVTYTLLLDDAAVLDHLPGAATRIGGRWLVTRRTYCDVSTQGATEIPPPCQ